MKASSHHCSRHHRFGRRVRASHGSGHNRLQPDAVVRAKPIAIGGAGSEYCRAVRLAGTQQRAGAARGSCMVVAQTAGNLVSHAWGVRSRALMQGGRKAQPVRVATMR